MKPRHRKAESSEVNAARQARLRERRKAEGYKRVSIWLSPEQVAALENHGGEPWLGSTVKNLLQRAVAKQAALFAVPEPQPDPLPDTALSPWAEAGSLHSEGLSWEAIARRWNAAGRKTVNGEPFRGSNIAREVRKWKGERG